MACGRRKRWVSSLVGRPMLAAEVWKLVGMGAGIGLWLQLKMGGGGTCLRGGDGLVVLLVEEKSWER